MQCHHTGEHHPTAMLLLLLPLAVLGATPVHDAPTELGPNVTGAVPLKVMPLGDSITYGCGDNCSSLCTPTLPCADCLTNGSYTPCALCSSGYRLPLWRRLTTASIDPIMVGPLTGGPADAPLTATHHAGWPGIRISGTASPDHTMGLVQAADIVGGWGVFAAQSEVILLHIGTNDILQNEYANASAAAADMGASRSTAQQRQLDLSATSLCLVFCHCPFELPMLTESVCSACLVYLLPLACASLSDPVTSLPPPGLQLSELLTVIHVHAPLSHILVASIISFAHTPKYEAFNAQAEAYNAALPLVRNFH